MSVTSINANTSQNLGALILQELTQGGAGASQDGGLSGILGDLASVSSASQSLAKAPAAVTQALQDLLTTQAGTSSDLDTLKSYFKDNPSALASLLANLGGTSTYSASGALSGQGSLAALLSGSSQNASALLSALAGSQGSSSLLTSLLGNQGSDPLLSSLGSDSSGSVSLFG